MGYADTATHADAAGMLTHAAGYADTAEHAGTATYADATGYAGTAGLLTQHDILQDMPTQQAS